MAKGYDNRRWQRYVHGMRRIRRDRAEHGETRTCPCFDEEVDKGRGGTFARFADHPCCDCGWCKHRWSPWEDSHFVPDE